MVRLEGSAVSKYARRLCPGQEICRVCRQSLILSAVTGWLRCMQGCKPTIVLADFGAAMSPEAERLPNHLHECTVRSRSVHRCRWKGVSWYRWYVLSLSNLIADSTGDKMTPWRSALPHAQESHAKPQELGTSAASPDGFHGGIYGA